MTLENPTLDDELQYEAVKKAGPRAVLNFMDMLAAGQTVRMAAMLATRKAPTTGITDQTYHKNMPHWREGMTDLVAKEWNRRYRMETGENIPDDAVIMRGFAERIGDKDVVLTSKHGLQDMKRVLESRGKHVDADFETNPVQMPPTPQVNRMDPGLVEEYRDEYIAEDPSLAEADQTELRERIIDTHTKKVEASDVLEPSYGTTFEDVARTVFEKTRRVVRIETSGSGAESGS